MSSKKKRINPRKKPATQADVAKAKKTAVDEAVSIAWAILFTVMRDKFGFGKIRLRRLWGYVNSLSEEITEGRISVDDLIKTLDEEAGLKLR